MFNNLSFFKTKKNRRYSVKHIYYDEKKDESISKKSNSGYNSEILKNKLKANWKYSTIKKSNNNRIRLIIVFAFVFFMLLYFNGGIEKIILLFVQKQ